MIAGLSGLRCQHWQAELRADGVLVLAFDRAGASVNTFSQETLIELGAGRLIRTEQDWGVLMVGDVRLVDKSYGKRLWRGLPPFARTRELDQALAFYAAREAQRV